MHPLDRIPSPLRPLVEARHGIVSRRELLDAGMTSRQVERLAGSVRRLGPGVYDLGGAPGAPLDGMAFEARCHAALLLAGGGAIDGEAALLVHGLAIDPPPQIEVAIGAPRRVVGAPGIRVVRHRHDRMTATRRGLTVVTAAEAVLTLSSTPREAIRWVTQACQQGITTPGALRAVLDPRWRHPQRALVEDLTDDIAAGATSALEVRFRRGVLVAHSLPLGVGQLRVPGSGRRADIGYEAERVLVELDSQAFHSGTARFADLRRDAEHAVDGWLTVRFGWPQATFDACRTARVLRDVLATRGGAPTFHPCSAC